VRWRLGGVFFFAALLGCKGQGQSAAAAEAEGGGERGLAESAAQEPPPKPPEPLPMGKTDLGGYAYSRGPGRAAFHRAAAAARSGDWGEAEAGCREALLHDPGHLEAHWLLARALTRAGRHDEAVAPLSAAVAGDWLRWGQPSLTAPELADFRASREGRAYLELAEQYRIRFQAAVRDGLLVVGRRGLPWYPKSGGPTSINHRSEIYAYDLATGRYLRVSRTDAALVGFVRSPSGNALAYASYRKVHLPEDPGRVGPEAAGAGEAEGEELPPVILREVKVGTVDLLTARMSEREITLADVRRVELFWAAEDELHARALPARNTEKLLRLDPENARAWPVATEVTAGGPALRVVYDAADIRQSQVAEVAADWDSARSAGAFRLLPTRRTITLPDGETASLDSLRWSPERSRLALSTRAVDPCSPDPDRRRSTLYVVDAASGVSRPLATGDGPFSPVWLDEPRLAYVVRGAGAPAVRLVDVTTGGELALLEAEGGLGTESISSARGCVPPRPVEPAADDIEDEHEPDP
jgi:hypothetical protein